MKKKVIDLSHLDSIEFGKNGRYKINLVDGSFEFVRSSRAVDFFLDDIEEMGKQFRSRYGSRK
ncbi:hypothetical protein [Anaerococcus tetradius]|uniref:Uncharacterized protein n=1 Tax=Anaerococcus tetradius TaxID=33036 RepID=A0A133KCX6_9FIRM|nr:hypothetical protein [Anaerococcus tetradius]KWZ77423.1 hypothetical protein HMPREF3200_01416 [Anaerococcus tetradius]